MSDAAKDLAAGGRKQQSMENWTIAVLSISALASSYASYQGGRWDGEQDANLALASTAETAASKEDTLAFQRESVNALHFTQWLNAYASGNDELEQFYRDRFRPSFRIAFDQWMATKPRFNKDSPPTPFDVPGYRTQARARATELAAHSDRLMQEAKKDMEISDSYGRAVVIFALSLFLGGMVQAFDAQRRKLILLGLAAVTTLLGLTTLIPLPFLMPG
jgi:hypothetical protein